MRERVSSLVTFSQLYFRVSHLPYDPLHVSYTKYNIWAVWYDASSIQMCVNLMTAPGPYQLVSRGRSEH
jgi:hypothetical protein